MPAIALYQVDAFTTQLFEGNPAAVCPLASWLPDAVLQAIAGENNLSETAFFAPEGDGFRLRWFTPAVEAELCGHATLASAYVILTHLEPGRERVGFETRSGHLEVVRRDGGLLEMDFPAQQATSGSSPDGLAEALGRAPVETLFGPNVMAVFETPEAVQALTPDMALVAAVGRAVGNAGIIATAPGSQSGQADFVSRFFAPDHGIPEDPVTGSAHCMLTPYWARRLGRDRLTARQISSRGGTVFCRLAGDRVKLGGHCVDYMTGTLVSPSLVSVSSPVS